jgi:hypothetical protein
MCTSGGDLTSTPSKSKEKLLKHPAVAEARPTHAGPLIRGRDPIAVTFEIFIIEEDERQ